VAAFIVRAGDAMGITNTHTHTYTRTHTRTHTHTYTHTHTRTCTGTFASVDLCFGGPHALHTTDLPDDVAVLNIRCSPRLTASIPRACVGKGRHAIESIEYNLVTM
jgi:hypothetical protein